VGAVVILGTLLGLVVVIFAVVLRFDPEARRSPRSQERDRGAAS
jgi:hypothetical protein